MSRRRASAASAARRVAEASEDGMADKPSEPAGEDADTRKKYVLLQKASKVMSDEPPGTKRRDEWDEDEALGGRQEPRLLVRPGVIGCEGSDSVGFTWMEVSGVTGDWPRQTSERPADWEIGDTAGWETCGTDAPEGETGRWSRAAALVNARVGAFKSVAMGRR